MIQDEAPHMIAYKSPGDFLADITRYVYGLYNAMHQTDQNARAQALAHRAEIIDRLLLHSESGLYLPIQKLCGSLNLSAWETDILFVYLASYYSSLNLIEPGEWSGDWDRGLTIGDALRLALPAENPPLPPWPIHRSNLFRWQILQIPDRPHIPLTSQVPALDRRIAGFLMGDTWLDASDTLVIITPSTETLPLTEQLQESLEHLALNLAKQPTQLPLIHLKGPDHCGQQETATWLAATLSLPCVHLDLSPSALTDAKFTLILREILLHQAAVFVTIKEEDEGSPEPMLRRLQTHGMLVMLSSQTSLTPDLPHIQLTYQLPHYQQRRLLWQNALELEEPPEVLLNYPFSYKQIHLAANFIKTQQLIRNQDRNSYDEADLVAGCRSQCNRGLESLAVLSKDKATWEDLVLPGETVAHLQEIPIHMSERHRVYEEWGLNRRVSYGRGTNILFTGPPGTGKTMAASVIANSLNLLLYRIDLSRVINKYIGETEKNLDRIFREAVGSGAILFFDEADALFGKRGEVRSANDRFANIETGYLLQKMEEFEGMSILATNLSQNMDDAFMRRIQFMVTFPFPDAQARTQIFNTLIRDSIPLQDDVDFEFLAGKMKVTGGVIKNIVIGASFMAAAENRALSMADFLFAARREWHKTGKPFFAEDFAPFAHLLER